MLDDAPGLHQRTVVVTGAASGIGHITARALARAGAHTILMCGDAQGGVRTCEALAHETQGRLDLVPVDLCDIEAVRLAVADVQRRTTRLNAVIHCVHEVSWQRTLTPQGIELGLALEVLAPWQLTGLLVPLLEASRPARVVTLVAPGWQYAHLDPDDLSWADRPFHPLRAAAGRQLARVLLTRAWARRLEPLGIGVYAVAPGIVRTEEDGPAPWWALVLADTVLRPAFTSPDLAAALLVRVATAPDLDVPSGTVLRTTRPIRLTGEASDDGEGERLWAALEALVRHPRHQAPGMHAW